MFAKSRAVSLEDSATKQANDSNRHQFPRRTFLRSALLAGVTAALHGSTIFVSLRAETSNPDLVRDTLNGLLAFIVPGPDAYSQAQGVTSSTLGGLDANVTEALIETLDLSVPFLHQFSATVATILNALAQLANPSAISPYGSPFANLKYSEKVGVLQMMDSTDALKPLGGVLPLLVAALCYSDAGTFDPATRSLTGTPVGWTISNYTGVSDGRDEFQGYFESRHSASPDA